MIERRSETRCTALAEWTDEGRAALLSKTCHCSLPVWQVCAKHCKSPRFVGLGNVINANRPTNTTAQREINRWHAELMIKLRSFNPQKGSGGNSQSPVARVFAHSSDTVHRKTTFAFHLKQILGWDQALHFKSLTSVPRQALQIKPCGVSDVMLIYNKIPYLYYIIFIL